MAITKQACQNCGQYEGHTMWCKHNTAVETSIANATQIGGDHYRRNGIQTWDYIASNGLGYFEGNVIKYVSRWRDKNGLEDLEKARHYLDKLIEMEKGV